MTITLRRKRKPVGKLLIAAGGAGVLLGALAMFVFDPQRGRSRRAKARDQMFGALRHGAKRVRRSGRRVRSDAFGLTQRMAHRKPEKVLDDTTLAQKIKSELFLHPEIPKGKISINVESGTAVVRGEVDSPQQILEVEELVEDVQGVDRVENLLHLKETPAFGEPETAGYSNR